MYADLHCTKADQTQLDKVSKLQKLIINKNKRPISTYGINKDSKYRAENIVYDNIKTKHFNKPREVGKLNDRLAEIKSKHPNSNI